MKKKGGISTKHSLLIIVILIIVIILILVLVFRGKILETNKSLLSKVELDLMIENVEIGNDSSITIDVKRSQGEGEIAGMRFVFEDEDESEIIDIKYLIQEEEKAQFTIFLEKIDSEDIINVKVYPIIELEGDELTVGSIKDEYKIRKSSILV